LATAVPRIIDDFTALNDVSWYGSAYLLTNCAFQLMFGRIYSVCSIKVVLLSAILIFEVGSAICGAAPTSSALIIGRAIAGIGAAGVFQGAFVIVACSVPVLKRPLCESDVWKCSTLDLTFYSQTTEFSAQCTVSLQSSDHC
jgi:MFS family permease